MSGSYVYRILVDGVPRYIGKGTGYRLAGHLAVLTGRKPRERIHGLMIEAAAAGSIVTGDKVAEGLTHHQAQNLEREMVAVTSGLWNLAPGGGGWNSRMAAKGWADPEKAAARRAAMNTPEAKARRSEAGKARWKDPEYRARVSAARRKSWEKGTYIMRRGHGFSHINSDPEARARGQAKSKAFYNTPEGKELQAAKSRALWADPVKRAEMLAARKAKAEARKSPSNDAI